MELVIGGNTYKLEYTFEAATYDDCVNKIFGMVAQSADGAMQQDGGKVLASIAGTPSVVITLFYAGLMEHNPVENEKAAKELLKQYFKDNKGENFHTVFTKINEQMETDGFFDLIGLTATIEEATKAAQEKIKEFPKAPKDHMKKQTSQH